MKRNWSDVTDQPRIIPESSSSSLLINVDLLGCDDNSSKLHRLLKLRDEIFIKSSSNLQRRNNNSNSYSRVMNNYEDIMINKRPHLYHLLISSATSVDENNISSAIDKLIELYQHISLTGDSFTRVAAYFTDALTSMVLTKIPPSFHHYYYDTSARSSITSSSSSSETFLGFTHLYRVSPYYQFIHFTANQAILEAFEREQDRNNMSLHVIDFELSYGLQWSSMIQSLSEKATRNRRVSFRITGFGTTLEELVETEASLVSFSKGFDNIDFEFLGLLKSSSCNAWRSKIKIYKNETVAVNLVFHLSSLGTYSQVSDTLKAVYSLEPSIVVLVEKEGNHHHDHQMLNVINSSGSSIMSNKLQHEPSLFLSGFMDSLYYYEAMFDSLDICLPRDSSERFTIEKDYLGQEIKQEILFMMMRNHHDHQYHDEHLIRSSSSCFLSYEKMDFWKAKMESHGFIGIELSSRTSMQAKLLLRIRGTHCHHHHHPSCENGDCGGGFRVCERDVDGITRVLSLGWQDRFLVTVSAWHPALNLMT